MQDLRIWDSGQLRTWLPDLTELIESARSFGASCRVAKTNLGALVAAVDFALEVAYQAATGRRPPGSWRTKRLRKKRRKAIYNLCGEEPLKG